MISPGLVAFFVILAVMTGFYAVFAPTRAVQHSDPIRPEDYVPGMFDKYVRPAVKNVLPNTPGVLGAYARGNHAIASLLQRSGNPWQVTPEEYVAVRLIAAAGGAALLSMMGVTGMFMFDPLVGFVGGLALGYFVPYLLLSSAWGKRKKDINRSLPEALDMLRICMNAGFNFTNGLSQIVTVLPSGATQTELTRVMADLRSGRTVSQALDDFSQRVPTESVEAFVRAVNVSQAMGTDMAQTLSAQANEARAQYERVIDVKSQKLQTTLFLPIIGIFLPVLMVIMFAPSLAQLGTAM